MNLRRAGQKGAKNRPAHAGFAAVAMPWVSFLAACDSIYGVGDLRGAPTGGGSPIHTTMHGGAGRVGSGAATSSAGGTTGTPVSVQAGGTVLRTGIAKTTGGDTGTMTALGGAGAVTAVAGMGAAKAVGGAGTVTAVAGMGAAKAVGGAGTVTAVEGVGVVTAVGGMSTLTAFGGTRSVITIGGTGETTIGAARDPFGVQMLYPSLAAGKRWYSNWDSAPRSFQDRDPYDEWVDVRQGNAEYASDADGTLKISGEWPRLDVRDPQLSSQWRNVEMTIYFRRVADEDLAWGGLMAIARTNHGILGPVSATENLCDTRGVGVRIRYDGQVEFVKETSHFVRETGEFADLTSVALKPLWVGGIPYDRWIGYKHVVYDPSSETVKQELWLDETDGQNGGVWVKVNEYLDAGGMFGKGGASCANGIDPSLPLTNQPERIGSESGAPNISVYFQSQAVSTDGLLYKWASVREIDAKMPSD